MSLTQSGLQITMWKGGSNTYLKHNTWYNVVLKLWPTVTTLLFPSLRQSQNVDWTASVTCISLWNDTPCLIHVVIVRNVELVCGVLSRWSDETEMTLCNYGEKVVGVQRHHQPSRGWLQSRLALPLSGCQGHHRPRQPAFVHGKRRRSLPCVSVGDWIVSDQSLWQPAWPQG